MRKLFWITFLCLITNPLLAQDNPSFEQTQLDAIFLVGEDSVTAMYSFGYTHSPEMDEIRWLFPIPADATNIELGPAYTLPLLQDKTDPITEPPRGVCLPNPLLVYGHGIAPFVEYLPSDAAEVVRLDSFAEAQDWLGNGLQDTASFSEYESFVGLTITPQKESPEGGWASDFVDISPLLLVEYPGTELFLPMKARPSQLTTILDGEYEQDMMPVTVYVLADQPYAPANFESASVDLTEIDNGTYGNAIKNIMRDFTGEAMFGGDFDNQYYYLVRQALEEQNGRAFMTEYRQAPKWSIQDSVKERLPDEIGLLDLWAEEYSVLTRMRTFVREGRDLPDPQFEATPQLEQSRTDLSTTADPSWFWGCTTRKLYDPDLESRLPSGRTFISYLNVYVAHPADWSLYTLNENTYVLSPEDITSDSLYPLQSIGKLESTGVGPPMLVLQRFEQEFVRDGSYTRLPDNTWEFYSKFTNEARPTAARNGITLYYPSQSLASPYNDEPLGTAEGFQAVVISTHADFVENEPLYIDMLNFIATRQYWLSPDLRHTLFMIGPSERAYEFVAVGYPEGWLEMLDENRLRVIAPAESVNFEEVPYVREIVPPERESADHWLRDYYNLEEDTHLLTLTPFHANGRSGFVQRTGFTNNAAIEVSAPDDLYEDFASLLGTIAQTMQIRYREE
ncbi:MAG: hypothetical protein K8L99_28425 [Anaerolineae bacterium]|nr:hypothetical protein [Anaerolineae bacterium]